MSEETTVKVNEIFFSVQGEGTRAGLPCVFVRLRGCHLRCAYCDTVYAFHEGGAMTIEEVIAEGQRLGGACALWQVTGGEPLLQKGVHDLMTRLCDVGKTVTIETSGACDISVCDPRVIRVLDFKTPGSGEADRNDWRNVAHLTERDEVKIVCCDRADYEWASSVIDEHRLAERCGAVLLSAAAAMPAGDEIAGVDGLSLTELTEWLLADRLAGVRVQTQLHKLIWDPMARGV
ncbi:MAG: radical SAM protein [Planctomycetota bacterium]